MTQFIRNSESEARTRRRVFFLITVALAAACSLWLSGCASKIYTVKVDANAIGPPPLAASFRLVGQASSPTGEAAMPSAFEVARRALQTKGLREATDAATPDLIVAVDCGLAVGAIRYEVSSVPVFVTVPGPIRYETQQVGTGPGGIPIMQTVPVRDPPTQELAGHQERTYKIETVKKFLRLVAAQKNPGDGNPLQKPVWGVQAYYESEDSDLKNALPVLAAAAMVFVGQVTRDQASIAIKDSDRDVAALRSAR